MENESLDWRKVFLSFVLGAVICGLAVAVYFLHTSNNDLEEQRNELLNTRNNLVTQVEQVQAESERLKTEALANDVFLK